MVAILTNQPVTICTNFEFLFKRRLHIKFEEKNGLGVSEEKSFQGVNRWTDTGPSGQQVITIAQLEPLAQVS